MFVICFIDPSMKRSKHGLFFFPPKKTVMWRRYNVLFDWAIVLQYDVKAKYLLISRKFSDITELFSPERLLNQPKAKRVCICWISYFVRLLFLFCSRVSISRSYENRSNFDEKFGAIDHIELQWGFLQVTLGAH